ncbi:uncharacterized protein (DUF849 family) [Murinocardiopsis flavida]|uniref:Uncharacterized protein (DUF849 family) n=1 Tax=Murinocardiopsis flavida TaxID=645275 RepID=A0A2P8DR34_9ACTN|nr:3-keto-5-aminohexanoate cleavage protein [Murinocardiopsis flavida]PSK99682.1 uncharacterized protein (DUF849 family) [Murinocardiopsis flavida]
MRIEACLNGDRRPGSHPALPVSPDQLAADARAVVAAGAAAVHIHPRDARGRESLEPQVIAPVLDRIRAAVPDVPISVTTALSAEPDPWRRFDLVQRWGALPDSVTVNLHEPGSVEVARLLIDRRVGVEAGVWTVESARILLASGLVAGFARVLLEPMQRTVADAVANADRIEELLDQSAPDLPRLLHGTDDTAWPVLDAAVGRGHDIRIGLEDTLQTPEGGEAADNAALVAHAVRRLRAAA